MCSTTIEKFEINEFLEIFHLFEVIFIIINIIIILLNRYYYYGGIISGRKICGGKGSGI